MADEVLRISDLNAWYGESHVLHGVDLAVHKGEVVTLLGRNGAGRTSTMKSILGLVGRRQGSIVVNGQETIGWPTYRIAHLGVGYCPEERGIFSSLSVEENLTLPPEIAKGGMSVAEIYEMFPNLRERRNKVRARKRDLNFASFGIMGTTALGVGGLAIGSSAQGGDNSRALLGAGAVSLVGLGIGTILQLTAAMQEEPSTADTVTKASTISEK